MIVSIATNERQARLWLPTQVTWASKADRAMGSAAFFVPRSSPLWGNDVIPKEGGAVVKFSDGASEFTGITDPPEWGADGAQVPVLEIAQWVGFRVPRRRRTFRAMTAGAIAGIVVRDAFEAVAALPVWVGACVECPPLIPKFELNGRQTVQQVLASLQDETGQEWSIDHATYEFRWQTEVGTYHEALVVDRGDLVAKITRPSLTERFQETTEVDSRTRRSFTAWNGETPLAWPSQTTVEV